MSYQNPNWTKQFQNLPEGWDTDPAIFDKMVEEHEFTCEGENCPIRGTAVSNGERGEGNLHFVKLVYTSLAMEADGVTPKRHPETGQKFFAHEDVWRHVFCYQHRRWAEGVAEKSHEGLSLEVKKRGDKVEAQSFPLFKNLKKLAEMSKKAKRSERVAAFFLSLTGSADPQSGIALDCIQPFNPATPKDEAHNYLIRGGTILGIVAWDDVRLYNAVRHQNKGAFIAANLYLYANSTLAYVEERLVEWRKSADEKAASKAVREAEAAERRRQAEDHRQESVISRDTAAAEVLALIKGATTPSAEPTVDRKGKKSPKQRKSAPPPSAARQIDEQLDAGGRASLSDGTPDVIVDEHAGSSKPTHAVALGDRPEVAKQIAAVRAAIEPTGSK